MHVEELTEDDWATLRDVRLRAVEAEPDLYGRARDREQRFAEGHWRMRLRAAPWFVAFADGRAVGLVGLIEEPGAPEDDRHAMGLWVAADARRHGAAMALLDAAEARAARDGARHVSVWVTDDDAAAQGLCERRGYMGTGVRAPTPGDAARTDERWVVMVGGERAGGPEAGSPETE